MNYTNKYVHFIKVFIQEKKFTLSGQVSTTKKANYTLLAAEKTSVSR